MTALKQALDPASWKQLPRAARRRGATPAGQPSLIPEECKLERFFSRYEFDVEHVLGGSDIEGYALGDLLELADAESLKLWSGLRLGYTETAGHPALREAIGGLYTDVPAGNVIVCAGAAEALYLLSHALLGPGTHAVVVCPAFESLYKVAAATGAQVSRVALDAADSWRLDLAALEGAVRDDTRAIFVNYPHNPTGALLGRHEFQSLMDFAGRRGITVVSDEVYRHLEFDPAARLPAAADLDPRAASVGVMSKSYGLAGLRIGWVASQDGDLLRRLLTLKDYTSVCSSASSEILALIALRAAETVVQRCKQIVLDNLVHVEAFMSRWSEAIEWAPPQAGTVAFPRLRLPIPVDEFVERLAREESVLLLPGSAFDDTENRFRIGLGRVAAPDALGRMDGFLTRALG
jgi:aspartate/methionine/tyrosine aminotransferase